MRTRTMLVAVVLSSLALPVFSQTNPDRNDLGQGGGQPGLALPGATVTASPRLCRAPGRHQLDQRGLHLPLPARGRLHRDLRAARLRHRNATSGWPQPERHHERDTDVSTVSETVTVVGRPRGLRPEAPGGDQLQGGPHREAAHQPHFLAAINLAPGVQATGPNGGIAISGAMSFENLFMVNGVVVNENLRGQPLDLFIEDALQETTITTAAVSAEFGRFSGGVVQAITKSGGNEFSGSFRTTFGNDDWMALTPFPNDRRSDKRGAHLRGDAGRAHREGQASGSSGRRASATTANRHHASANREPLRLGATRSGTRASSPRRSPPTTPSRAPTRNIQRHRGRQLAFGTIMDLDSLVRPRARPRTCSPLNYTGILSPQFFVEAPVLAAQVHLHRHRVAVHRPHQGHAAHRPQSAQQRPLQLADLLRRVRRREARQPERPGQGHLLPLHRAAWAPTIVVAASTSSTTSASPTTTSRAATTGSSAPARSSGARTSSPSSTTGTIIRWKPIFVGERGQPLPDLLRLRQRRLDGSTST